MSEDKLLKALRALKKKECCCECGGIDLEWKRFSDSQKVLICNNCNSILDAEDERSALVGLY